MDWGQESSTRLTASSQVKDTHGRVLRIVVENTSAAEGYVKLYNATSATGTPAWEITTPADGGWIRQFTLEQEFPSGIYAELSNVQVTITYL